MNELIKYRPQLKIHSVQGLQLNLTTKIFLRKTEEGKIEARQGISRLGLTGMTQKEWSITKGNPFHKDFTDRYAAGIGKTKEEALKFLKENLEFLNETFEE